MPYYSWDRERGPNLEKDPYIGTKPTPTPSPPSIAENWEFPKIGVPYFGGRGSVKGIYKGSIQGGIGDL